MLPRLTDGEIHKVLAALAACTPTGGDSTQSRLYRKILQANPTCRPDADLVTRYQKIAAEEIGAEIVC